MLLVVLLWLSCSCWSCYLLLYIVVYSRCICSCLLLFVLACLWLSCCLLLLYIVVYSLCAVSAACLLVYPLIWYSLAPWCVSVAPRGMLCVVSSCRLQLVVLACLVGRLSWSVVPVITPCRWSYRLVGRLVVPLAVGCRACSLLLSVVLSCLLLWSCYLIARSGHRLAPPLVPSGGQAPDPQRGGDFSKRGERQAETHPRPHFYARGQKKCGFSAQNG